MKVANGFFCTGLIVIVGGCATSSTPPLIFGQSHILGIAVSTGTSGQAGDFTLGYKSFDLAIVPVIAVNKDGSNTQVESSSNSGAVVDALSVLGQFNTSTATGTNGNVSLGEFFSTGAAAQALSVGFAVNLCNTASKTIDSTTSNQASSATTTNCAGVFGTTAKGQSLPGGANSTSSPNKLDTADGSATKSNGSASTAGQSSTANQTP